MNFFAKHPNIHTVVHYLLAGTGFILATQDKLLAATALIPEGSSIPRFVGYGLAVLSFSNIFLGRVDAAGDSGIVAAPIDDKK